MWVVVIYDIRNSRRLSRVAKVMEGYGKRVQRSVFECQLELSHLKRLQREIENIINKDEDSVKYFRLCGKCFEKSFVLGQCERHIVIPEVEII